MKQFGLTFEMDMRLEGKNQKAICELYKDEIAELKGRLYRLKKKYEKLRSETALLKGNNKDDNAD